MAAGARSSILAMKNPFEGPNMIAGAAQLNATCEAEATVPASSAACPEWACADVQLPKWPSGDGRWPGKNRRQPHQLVQRFFGGPPLAVIGRLILLSILVGVILAAIGLDPWNIIDWSRLIAMSGRWASTPCAGSGGISCLAPSSSCRSGSWSGSPRRRAAAKRRAAWIEPGRSAIRRARAWTASGIAVAACTEWSRGAAMAPPPPVQRETIGRAVIAIAIGHWRWPLPLPLEAAAGRR